MLVIFATGCVSENQEYLVSCASYHDYVRAQTTVGPMGIMRGLIVGETTGVFLVDELNRKHFLAPHCKVMNITEGHHSAHWEPVGLGTYYGQVPP